MDGLAEIRKNNMKKSIIYPFIKELVIIVLKLDRVQCMMGINGKNEIP